MFGLTLLLLGALAAPAAAAERPSQRVPVLGKEPTVDGKLGDLSGGLKLSPASAGAATYSARVATRKSALHLGVTLVDPTLNPGDALTVLVFFPNAGTTARGYAYRFSADGPRAPDAELAAPAFAQSLVKSALQKTDDGYTLELAFPARSLPRLPARDPLLVELCLVYEDRDAPGQPAREVSNCTGGAMNGAALQLADAFRKDLKLGPPASVQGLEAREGGWLGFGRLHSPVWAQVDQALTPASLAQLVAETPLDPVAAKLPLPTTLKLSKGQALHAVYTGKDPYAAEGQCLASAEVRVSLYVVQEKTAVQVLDWPVSTCALGRALSFELDGEDALTIGYSGGAVMRFAWTGEHFEQTQFGKR